MIHSLRPCAHLVSANKDALPDSRQHPAFKCLISWHQQLDGGVVIRSSNRGLDHSIERMLWRNHLAPSTAGMANTNLTEWKKENVLLLWTDVASSSERSQLVCGLCLVIHVVAVVILSTLIHFCLWHDNIKPATSSYFLLPQM
ncbi:hypothetical protein Pelo_12384 [Pelomyxa schiedti]|nr:hypothetical protein Pelo_12384 [Pelomyxa schiedti]